MAAPAGRDESDGRKSANPDMPDLIKRLAQSLKIVPPLCIVQDCHSPSIVPGLRAIPHLAIYRPGDPVVGRDLNHADTGLAPEIQTLRTWIRSG